MNKHSICHLCGGFGRACGYPHEGQDILAFRCIRCGTTWACNKQACDLCHRLEWKFRITHALSMPQPQHVLLLADYLEEDRRYYAMCFEYDRIVLSGGRLALRDEDGSDPIAVALDLDGAPTVEDCMKVLRKQHRIKEGSKRDKTLRTLVEEALDAVDHGRIHDVGFAFGRDKEIQHAYS